jgi:hypothetical protein
LLKIYPAYFYRRKRVTAADAAHRRVRLLGMRANLSNACQSEAEEVQNEVIQMTTYGGKELANAFRTVRKNTIQVAEDIPESKYDYVAAPECKTVGRMLTHIAVAVRFWDDVQRKQRRTTCRA